MGSVDTWVTWQQLADPAGHLETFALTVLSLGVVGLLVVRWVRASGPARRRWAPGLFAGTVLALGFVITFWLQTIAPESARTATGELRVIGLAVLRILVAVALLVGVLRDHSARGRIADLVVRLEGLPSTSVLEASLREALGDASLVVFRWSPEGTGYLDAHDRPSDPPPDDPSRATLRIDHDGRPALLIVHDPSLRDDPALIGAAVAAVRLAVDNERLQAEVRTQLEAIQASRARLVEAQDSERRRIERDLHDGAQQRLVSLQLSLQMLRTGLGRTSTPKRGPSSTPRPRRRGLRSPRSANSPVVSTRRSSPRPASGRRWRPSPSGHRCPSTWPRRSIDGCPPRSRRPPTSSLPRP